MRILFTPGALSGARFRSPEVPMLELGRMPRSARRSRSDALGQSQRAERRGFQLGPKIRVGGTLGRIGQNAKNAVVKAAKDAGHAVGDVASNPFVQYATAAALAATGVGAPAAAAILAAEKGGGALLKPGGNIGEGIKGGVEGAAMGYGAAKLGAAVRAGMSAAPGGGGGGFIQGAKNFVSGGGADAKGHFGVAGDLAVKLVAPGGSAAPGTSVLDRTLQTAGLPPEGGFVASAARPGASLMDKLLLVGSVADQAADRQRQRSLENKALGYATGAYDANAPLRDEARKQLENTTAPDLSYLFNDPANPYSRNRSGYLLGARTPVTGAA